MPRIYTRSLFACLTSALPLPFVRLLLFAARHLYSGLAVLFMASPALPLCGRARQRLRRAPAQVLLTVCRCRHPRRAALPRNAFRGLHCGCACRTGRYLLPARNHRLPWFAAVAWFTHWRMLGRSPSTQRARGTRIAVTHIRCTQALRTRTLRWLRAPCTRVSCLRDCLVCLYTRSHRHLPAPRTFSHVHPLPASVVPPPLYAPALRAANTHALRRSPACCCWMPFCRLILRTCLPTACLTCPHRSLPTYLLLLLTFTAAFSHLLFLPIWLYPTCYAQQQCTRRGSTATTTSAAHCLLRFHLRIPPFYLRLPAPPDYSSCSPSTCADITFAAPDSPPTVLLPSWTPHRCVTWRCLSVLARRASLHNFSRTLHTCCAQVRLWISYCCG